MKYVFFTILLILLFSCGEGEQQITDSKDYNSFLAAEPIATNSKYFDLWNSKIRPDSMQLGSFGIVAGEYNRYFEATGDVQFLKKAEQSLERAIEIAAIGKAGYLRSLARNYISQHRFREALKLAKEAKDIGSGLYETEALLFDIHMELGNYIDAKKYLDLIENPTNFGYLIRAAKWNDHLGDLDTAIHLMELAKLKVEEGNNSGLQIWVYTNLADYYGHAGKINASYQHYLKSLQLDPQNAHAKKGIAWIVFSHERNAKEALRILNAVTEHYNAPDYQLLKAEIAAYMGKDLEEKKYLDSYYAMVQNIAYGEMYNVQNAYLYLEETQQYDLAISIAEREVENRPTPQSYSLLAYSWLKKGEKDKALEITEKHVNGRTFEPQVLLQNTEIYRQIGNLEKANALKSELTEAVYELGPSFENTFR